jgi:3alpha(or 20beta)-hydroxysteroid dehydrogenase
MGRLDGKVAIVTGSARGTGEATVRRFVAEGARVVVSDVADDPGKAVADSLGDAAIYVHLDVTSPDAWTAAVAEAEAAFGRLDVLVNNAALLHLGSIEATPLATWERLVAVNQTGAFLGIQAVIPALRRAGGGSIVNVGSIDALQGLNGVSSYAASKWALRGLTKSAAMELGRDGIRVNQVCPAGGNPEMYAPWFGKLAGFLEQTRAYTENRGLPGTAPFEAVADAVVFLASDASSHCTGVDLPVDGGAHVGNFIPGFNSL